MIPVWLLRTFGCGPSVDALIGDITEEYRGGKSVLWVWRQALLGIVVSFVAAVRAQPLLAASGGALAWALMFAIGAGVSYAVEWVVVVLQVSVPEFAPRQLLTTDGRYVFWNPIIPLLISSGVFALTGATLARVCGGSRRLVVLAFALTVAGLESWRMLNAPDMPSAAVLMTVPWWHPIVWGMWGWVNLLALFAGGLRSSDLPASAHGADARRSRRPPPGAGR